MVSLRGGNDRAANGEEVEGSCAAVDGFDGVKYGI